MSLVERLAEKQANHFEISYSMNRERDARWWINAIADELEREDARRTEVQRYKHLLNVPACRWLRIQANEE